MVPLAPGRTTFTLEEVKQAIESFRDERAATRVGVISIESLVRRQEDAMFDGEQMRRISDYARAQEVRMHLDGARLFVEAVHREIAPAQQAALFDTVFVSLSKCFNSASGAILAGPADFIDDFIADYRAAWSAVESLFQHLDEDAAFRVERIPQGTHIVRLHVAANLSEFAKRLRKCRILLATPAPGEDWFTLKVNPSILRMPAADLVAAFRAAV